MAENYVPKNGQFTVWKNEKFEVGGNKPYAKGKGLDLNGKEIEVTLWIPKSDKIKGFNLTISEPYVSTTQENTNSIEQEDGDGLPF